MGDKEGKFRQIAAVIDMPSVVSQLPLLSLAPASRKVYARAVSDYVSYCRVHGIEAFPPSYRSMMTFLVALFIRGIIRI